MMCLLQISSLVFQNIRKICLPPNVSTVKQKELLLTIFMLQRIFKYKVANQRYEQERLLVEKNILLVKFDMIVI